MEVLLGSRVPDTWCELCLYTGEKCQWTRWPCSAISFYSVGSVNGDERLAFAFADLCSHLLT